MQSMSFAPADYQRFITGTLLGDEYFFEDQYNFEFFKLKIPVSTFMR
jgi:hypothetical protein